MGFFSSFTRSWKKSARLRELQRKIAPPGETSDAYIARFMESLGSKDDGRKKVLEDFFDLCESDPGVSHVMKTEGLSRSDLTEMYGRLQAVGLGQWARGHYVALSTLAFAEPLLYLVRSEKSGAGLRAIAGDLLDYWESKIPEGALLRRVARL